MTKSAAHQLTEQDARDGAGEYRSRLLQGLAVMVQEKAYGAITIADIVREAGMSKRGFYEHFDSKESCFLALYSAASASALRTLRAAVSPDQPWHTQIEIGLSAYFDHLSCGPKLLRALFIDIHDLGDTGAKARRETMNSLAEFMLETVNGQHAGQAPANLLTPELAMAAVGGINELVLCAIETDRLSNLAELTPAASRLVRLLTQTPLQAAAPPMKNPAG